MTGVAPPIRFAGDSRRRRALPACGRVAQRHELDTLSRPPGWRLRLLRAAARTASRRRCDASRDHRGPPSCPRGRHLASTLNARAKASFGAISIDSDDPGLPSAIRDAGVDAVVHAAGPFQGQDYQVARACIATRSHYIDLADSRSFVSGIGALDAAATRQNVLVTSGASSVPALSGAAVDYLVAGLSSISAIDIAISAGNRTDRGLATVAAILSCCGAPFEAWSHGRPQIVHGWQGLSRRVFPSPVGARWVAHCDVPDLVLFPRRYGSVERVAFRAGVDLHILQLGLFVMAALRRAGLVRDWSRHARGIARASALFASYGSDAGGMMVEVCGRLPSGARERRRWTMIATNGHGPYVPTLASVALVGKLARGQIDRRGAFPCVGILSLDDFAATMTGLAISTASSSEQ